MAWKSSPLARPERREMAYLKELTSRCSCGKQALVALYSFRNEEQGRFCRVCGNRALARQRQREKSYVREESMTSERTGGKK